MSSLLSLLHGLEGEAEDGIDSEHVVFPSYIFQIPANPENKESDLKIQNSCDRDGLVFICTDKPVSGYVTPEKAKLIALALLKVAAAAEENVKS